TREKFARMATLIYATETMTYRTSGLVDARLAERDRQATDHDAHVIASIEEYAIESSIMKVFGSEAAGQNVDDAVQIHGGAGFIEEYPVERAYRDARINRIFEGTNEINRMLISGLFLKRGVKGELPLFAVAQSVEEELTQGTLPRPRRDDALAEEEQVAELLKRMALYGLKVAAETFGTELEQHQEVLAGLADVVMDAFAMDSMVTRTRQSASNGTLDPTRVAMTRLYGMDAMARSFDRTRRALCSSAQGEALQKHLARVAQLQRFTPYNPAELREQVVTAVEQAGGFPLWEASEGDLQ
ncbi:acyl-CoA dehydrogenase family protein, partial [Hyalangium sp.]|uniref:acyl-CoA dehydrogenase family protein n=1 Tax=Hyalangium sp. TaxID=2028555 RepID=UPI002D30D353